MSRVESPEAFISTTSLSRTSVRRLSASQSSRRKGSSVPSLGQVYLEPALGAVYAPLLVALRRPGDSPQARWQRSLPSLSETSASNASWTSFLAPSLKSSLARFSVVVSPAISFAICCNL